jgi:HTH-type transcriptional regulator/antitoxin HipB
MHSMARTPKQIGCVIQRARRSRGWTQTDLGQRSGLRQATVSAIETGETSARLESILRLLAALELEIRIEARAKASATDIDAVF